jgi:hypothetical protein
MPNWNNYPKTIKPTLPSLFNNYLFQPYEAQLIGTACPYCLTMLFDGIKEKGKSETMAAYDLSELVLQSI